MIRTLPDLESLCREAAALFVRQAQLSLTHLERFAVALSGGQIPGRLYEILSGLRPANWSGLRTRLRLLSWIHAKLLCLGYEGHIQRSAEPLMSAMTSHYQAPDFSVIT
jgi:hypothetical protein